MTTARTFAEVLTELEHDAGEGHTYVVNNGKDTRLTYAELTARVSRTAAQLLASGLSPGDRVGLILTEPESFIRCFLAALRVGIVPVPLYPPLSFGRFEAYLESTTTLLTAARAKALLTTREIARVLYCLIERVPGMTSVLCEGDLPEPAPSLPPASAIAPNETAFLQFTSGSTDRPKGVQVTHAGLIANSVAIMPLSLKADRSDRPVSWLPLYHDMGLIGFVLAPLVTRSPVVFVPTIDFLRKPQIWMETMSRTRGTISFAPNFAFALAAKRTESLEGLDLSCVRVLGCAAEPIFAPTLREFSDRFAPAKLRPEAIVPTYGMAEATLAMSFADRDAGVIVDRIDAEQYHRHGRAVPAKNGRASVEFVNCGRAIPSHGFAIVDPHGRELPERTIGEIVFSGASVAGGYFEQPEATSEAFTAKGLRTGDLGYLVDGAVYVTGRKKDVLILQGRNYDPQSIERHAMQVEGVRAGNVIAFTRPEADTEALVIVAETSNAEADRRAIAAAIRKRVQSAVGVSVADVVVTGKGALPKTSSGKLQRRKAREQYLAGKLGAEGIRTVGANGAPLVIARYVLKSLLARVRFTARSMSNALLEVLS